MLAFWWYVRRCVAVVGKIYQVMPVGQRLPVIWGLAMGVCFSGAWGFSRAGSCLEELCLRRVKAARSLYGWGEDRIDPLFVEKCLTARLVVDEHKLSRPFGLIEVRRCFFQVFVRWHKSHVFCPDLYKNLHIPMLSDDN